MTQGSWLPTMTKGRAIVAAALIAVTLPSPVFAVGSGSAREQINPHYAENRYLAAVMELLEEGISNRVAFDRALRTRRGVHEYQELLNEFRSRQLGFLLKLRALETPPRLIPFHEQLRSAIVTQTAFYSALVAAKMRDPNVSVDWMSGHPALRASRDALQAAFEHLRRLHPALDLRTEARIEGQLSWLEVL